MVEFILEALPFIIKSLEASTLFLLAAIGELIDQRSGVLNVGVEGLMLFGGVSAFITAKLTGDFILGFVVGAAVGALAGLLHGALSISLKVDQVVSGMGIWIFAFGATTFIGQPFTTTLGMQLWTFLGLSPFFYLGVALVAITWFVLYRTGIGLTIRSVGEDPFVAEASGIKVGRIRYLCVIIGGVLGGLAGAFLTLVYTPLWTYNATSGRGWISLALVFFSLWNPWILLAGSLFFGAIWQLALSPEYIFPALGIPLYFYRMIPFVATILVLTILSTQRFRRRMGLTKPAALGLPFLKEE